MSLLHGPWVATDLPPDCEFLKSPTWQPVTLSLPGPAARSFPRGSPWPPGSSVWAADVTSRLRSARPRAFARPESLDPDTPRSSALCAHLLVPLAPWLGGCDGLSRVP